MLIDVEKIIKKLLMEYKLKPNVNSMRKLLRFVVTVIDIDKEYGIKLVNNIVSDIILRDSNRFKLNILNDNDTPESVKSVSMYMINNGLGLSSGLFRLFSTISRTYPEIYSDVNAEKDSEIMLFLNACVAERFIPGKIVKYCLNMIKNDFTNLEYAFIDYKWGDKVLQVSINNLDILDNMILSNTEGVVLC